MREKTRKGKRKKLSRQYGFMVFAIQAVMIILSCVMLRKGSIDIYLAAKKDAMTTDLHLDRENLSSMKELPWAVEYWKEHGKELWPDGVDVDTVLETEGLKEWGAFVEGLPEDVEEVTDVLNSFAPEDQKKIAMYCYQKLLGSFGCVHDSMGFEGNGCFVPLGDGNYMDLVWINLDSQLDCEPFYIYSENDFYDSVMESLGKSDSVDGHEEAVEFYNIRLNKKDGRRRVYVGLSPVVMDGKVVAVIQLQYNYDRFSKKIDQAIGLIILIMIVVYTLLCIAFIHRSRRIATTPLTSIENAVREYMTTRNSESARAKLSSITTRNEIGDLAEEVDLMIEEINDYLIELEDAGKQMKNLTGEVMEALASAIDAKDTYTNGHSRRVADYSAKIAEAAGKSPEDCEKIYFAALLHDVGKIGVPIEILTKKGRLTKEEFDYIKQHPVQGSQILANISNYPWLAIGAKYHHERFNGKGYPEGLSGTDIPEIARIIAVADAYDAMTSNRSYRDAMPQHIVREELVKGTGTQFDPDFARIMIHMIDLDIEFKMKEDVAGTRVTTMEGIRCDRVYEDCTDGITVTRNKTKIRMISQPDEGVSREESLPTLIVFDSLDGLVHPGEEENKEILYFEYAKVRLDGQVKEGHVRKSQVLFSNQETDIEQPGVGDTQGGQKYKIEAVRNRDHAQIVVSSDQKMFTVVLALPDTARYVYISLSGENCEIHNIMVDVEDKETDGSEISQIAEPISYIRGCPVGNIPNVEVDGPREAATKGIPLSYNMTLSFHTQSYPTSRLVWHCPYFSIFSSANGEMDGADFREYLLIKMDGENWDSKEEVKNEVQVEQTPDFKGWEAWMEKNREGVDCKVKISREGNRIHMQTTNLGIAVESVTTILDGTTDLYIALTGDQCAMTNIWVERE